MIRVRYKQGVVGETRRVVHVAWQIPREDSILTLCGAQMSPSESEVFDDGGMPCMQCAARASLAAEQPQIVAER